MLIKSWTNQASDEDIFEYLRGDFSKYFASVFSPKVREELNIRALNFVWSKNDELQKKYPHFEGISTLTEAQKT